jgi:hypothetical protein
LKNPEHPRTQLLLEPHHMSQITHSLSDIKDQ